MIQAAFEEVTLTMPFEPKMGEMLPADIQNIHQAGIIPPLIFHIVNGKNGGCVFEHGIMRIDRVQKDGHGCRMPVVCMHDVRREPDFFA